MSTGEALVVFTPSGRRGRFARETSVLDAARALGVDVDSICGGVGICGRCQVTVSEGVNAKHAIESRVDHLSARGPMETDYRGARPLREGARLGCAAKVLGDVVIDVPPESQVHRQVVRKEADAHPIEVDPVVRLAYVEVAEPDLAAPSGDLRRLEEALERGFWWRGLSVDHHVLASLQRVLREARWKVTVAVHDDAAITGMWYSPPPTSENIAPLLYSSIVLSRITPFSGTVMSPFGFSA